VRGIPAFNVVECLRQGAKLMERWGGHSQAGGFSVPTACVDELRETLTAWADERLAGVDLRPVFEADTEIPLGTLRGPEIKLLPYFEPCGQENPTPVLVSRRVAVMSARTMGAEGKHLRLKVKDGPVTWDAVAFGMGHAAPRAGSRVDLLYTVGADRRGFGMELQIKDLASAV
jgi:single-stranded-DNA-specific exonuclease